MNIPFFHRLLPRNPLFRSSARFAARTLTPALLALMIAAPAALADSPAPAAPVAGPAVAIRGDTVYPVSGSPIKDGLVLIRDGRIAYVGPAAGQTYGADVRELRAAVVVPGLVDARATVGVSGMLNQPHDQEQVDRSAPLQPELRAVDAYNARDELVAYVRARGVTTVHTGHGPGVPISGDVLGVSVLAESGGWRDPNRRDYTVRVALEQRDDLALKPSMRCKAQILLDEVREALSVPVQAVFRKGRASFVYVPDGGGFAQKLVRVGRTSEVDAEIVDGLAAGDVVLLREPRADEITSQLSPESVNPPAADSREARAGTDGATGAGRPGRTGKPEAAAPPATPPADPAAAAKPGE